MRTPAPVLAAMIIAACSSSTPAPAPAPANGATQAATTRTEVLIGESFRPKTDDASINAFKFAITPVDSGGECRVVRTEGNGSTIVTASYPSLADARTTSSLQFDSAGHVLRFSESYLVRPRPRVGPLPKEQLDSALRASNRVPQSGVTLNYPFDQAILTNRSDAGTDGVLAPIRRVEKLAKFGPLTDRLTRMRKLCGV